MLWELEKGSTCGDFCMHGKLSKLIQSSMPQGLRIPSFQLRSFFLRIAKVCGFLVMLADTALCTAVSLSEGQRKESQLSFLMDSWLCCLFVLGNSLHGICSMFKMDQNGDIWLRWLRDHAKHKKWESRSTLALRKCTSARSTENRHGLLPYSWLNCTLSSLVFHRFS